MRYHHPMDHFKNMEPYLNKITNKKLLNKLLLLIGAKTTITKIKNIFKMRF